MDKKISLLQEINQILEAEKRNMQKQKNLFNVFDILKLDTNETRTHSAFIGELLNPHGTHLMGEDFIRLFLDEVIEKNSFSLENGVHVGLEKSIGKIDYENLRGGRVDIFISNRKGQSICIENKIYAKLQKAQLERNMNWNRKNNRLLFLTLTKKTEVEVSPDFIGQWQQITYEEHIVLWLERCLNELDLYPQLVETIKQYLKLIYRLSGKLIAHEMNDQLTSLILDNIAASKCIADNYEKVLANIKIEFQKEVYQKLKEKISNQANWIVEIGNKANSPNAQIWVRPISSSKRLWFGLESFSGRGYFANRLTQGIISIEKEVEIESFNQLLKLNGEKQKGWWYHSDEIFDQNGYPVNLNDEQFVVRIEKENAYRSDLCDYIVENFLKYFNLYSEKILDLVQVES